MDLFESMRIDTEMSIGGSTGNLRKWIATDEVGKLWIKGRSNDSTFEPEAEVCAYKLAVLFGIPAIEYDIIQDNLFDSQPVCICRDFSKNQSTISLYKYLISVGFEEISTLTGADKFKLVESVLSNKDKELHRQTLLLDYIVGNKDRHLRNFEFRINSVTDTKELVEMFDTGASFFSDVISLNIVKKFCNYDDNYVQSKPYSNLHYKQLEILQEIGYSGLLKKVNKEDVYTIINGCFKKDRSKLINSFVIRNIERLGLLL